MHLQYPEFPDYSAARARMTGGPASAKPPVCTGALSYRDVRPVEGDLALLKEAAEKAKAPSCFMTAASPGVIAMFASETSHYATEDDYVFALAEAMKPEYAAIAKAGVTLQIDCPDLTLAKRMNYADGARSIPIASSNATSRRPISRSATFPASACASISAGAIMPGRTRTICPWPSSFRFSRKTKARALSFEAANPRHEHEWEDWRDSRLPDDMILIPGVIDSVTNFVEHPRLVGQRLRHFVDAVGAERVIAGADCGFGTFAASTPTVFPSIVWESCASCPKAPRWRVNSLFPACGANREERLAEGPARSAGRARGLSHAPPFHRPRQRVIDARLPAGAFSLERVDDIGVEPQGDMRFRACELQLAARAFCRVDRLQQLFRERAAHGGNRRQSMPDYRDRRCACSYFCLP